MEHPRSPHFGTGNALEAMSSPCPKPAGDLDWDEDLPCMEAGKDASSRPFSKQKSAITRSAQTLQKIVVLPAEQKSSYSRGTSSLTFFDEALHRTQEDSCGSDWVMTEYNCFRVIWSIITVILLIYLATLYLFHFSFVTFQIGGAGDDREETPEVEPFWKVMELVVEVVFIADIFINFFLSYKDERGTEIVSLRKVAKKYICTNFIADVVACVPDEAGEKIVSLFVKGEAGAHQAVEASRLVKLQRMQRLTRLIRLTRVARCLFSKAHSSWAKWLQSFRGIRIINFLCCLVWTVHVMACGWYITASMHTRPENTWVARRAVNDDGDLLVAQPAFEQWLHSMYFIMSVFTTVGFGDMSAFTEAEIVYVLLVMVVGAVVHSIVISEVITIVTSTDRLSEFKDNKFKLVDAFAAHAQLSDEMVERMKVEITFRAQHLMENSQDKGDMEELMIGKFFPRWLIGTLPDELFRGRIKKSHFLTSAQELTPSKDFLPPSLVCLLAIHLNQCEYEMGEVVFQKLDYPFHLYLVSKGSFANVAIPSPTGGIDAPANVLIPGGTAAAIQGVSPKDIQAGVSLSPGNCAQSMNSVAGAPPADQADHSKVYVYRSYSYNNYFGDFELLPGKPRPRLATVRCETAEGLCLVLGKEDFVSIYEKFPQYASPWVVLGRRREWFRTRQRRQLVHGLSLKSLSALRIQRHWRVARTWIQRPQSGRRNETSHRPDLVFMRKPVEGTQDTAAGNGASSEDLSVIRKDIKDLKDTMKLVVKEMTAMSNAMKSSRYGGAANSSFLPDV